MFYLWVTVIRSENRAAISLIKWHSIVSLLYLSMGICIAKKKKKLFEGL